MYVCHMIPTYPYSLSSSSNSNSTYYSTMPIIDLNIVDDQSHELIFSPTNQPSSSSSSSLSSCPILFNPSQHHHHDHAGSSRWDSKNVQNDHHEVYGKNIIASRGSWNNDPDQKEKGGDVEIIRKRGLKLKVWKRSSASSRSSEREEDDENYNNHNHNQTEDNNDSMMKWMPSKMRMMRKMMVASSKEDQNQRRPLLLSPRGTDHNSSSSNNSSTHSNSNSHSNNNITVRVCSDCHTTKTPLWRSGPRGPKSLCNACGIRQRKARRAMAAAAANGGSPAAAEKSMVKEATYKVHSNKEKRLKLECESHHHMKKKKHKIEDDHYHQGKEANGNSNNNNNSRGRSSSSSSMINKFSFEDFTVSLMSNNLAAASQVFPQDEKEAAILLMALSCNGLVHG